MFCIKLHAPIVLYDCVYGLASSYLGLLFFRNCFAELGIFLHISAYKLTFLSLMPQKIKQRYIIFRFSLKVQSSKSNPFMYLKCYTEENAIVLLTSAINQYIYSYTIQTKQWVLSYAFACLFIHFIIGNQFCESRFCLILSTRLVAIINVLHTLYFAVCY